MPKIRDLGIKVIPETMRPPEANGGGGGGPCANFTVNCIGCTNNPTFGCNNFTNLHPCIACSNIPSLQQCPLNTILPCIGCTRIISIPCLCTHLGSIPCRWGSGGCGAISPFCGVSHDPLGDPSAVLTRDQVAALREQLQQQIAALDEHAKTLGPKTVEEIDAREKQLNEELAQLKTRRKELNK